MQGMERGMRSTPNNLLEAGPTRSVGSSLTDDDIARSLGILSASGDRHLGKAAEERAATGVAVGISGRGDGPAKFAFLHAERGETFRAGAGACRPGVEVVGLALGHFGVPVSMSFRMMDRW